MTDVTTPQSGLLDCTLRDGGYYTNWHFSPDLVASYIDVIARSPIEAVELGFAGKDPDSGYYGAINAARSCEILGERGPHGAVMIDAKDFLGPEDTLETRLRRSIGAADEGRISIVRVAVKYTQAPECAGIIRALRRLGYRPFLNLMQIDFASEAELFACVNGVSEIPDVEAIYVADSFGSMMPERVAALVQTLHARLGKPIGFHAHDNRGLALVNAVQARQAGARWIDSTIAGMGRGAGNAATEQLLPVLEPTVAAEVDTALQELNVNHFQALRRTYGWGASVLYGYAAAKAIHPMYVQTLCQDGALGAGEVFHHLRQLALEDATSFDDARLTRLRRELDTAAALARPCVQDARHAVARA
jgi:4-hydroxy 2-oxovalerate aldolase